MNEAKVIKALSDAIQELAMASISRPFDNSSDIAYQLGLRQGKYNGLRAALELITLEQKQEITGEMTQ